MKEILPNQITAVVLAGGFGRRIEHLLPDLAQADGAGGREALFGMGRALSGRQDIRRVILSTGHLAAVVEKHFQSQPVPGVDVRCVPETEPLGTAGGFLNAIRQAGDPPAGWLVLNGDSLAPAPLDEMVQSHCRSSNAGAILGVPMPDASRYGTILQDPKRRPGGVQRKEARRGSHQCGRLFVSRPD
jgi:D-glycero-alpha-D-manno-heptose 1-phosphate guanylyltransferase